MTQGSPTVDSLKDELAEVRTKLRSIRDCL